jgi:hypothetical protein
MGTNLKPFIVVTVLIVIAAATYFGLESQWPHIPEKPTQAITPVEAVFGPEAKRPAQPPPAPEAVPPDEGLLEEDAEAAYGDMPEEGDEGRDPYLSDDDPYSPDYLAGDPYMDDSYLGEDHEPAPAQPAPEPAPRPEPRAAEARPAPATQVDKVQDYPLRDAPPPASVVSRWWPAQTPAGTFALTHAGQLAGDQAVALMFSAPVALDSVRSHVQVLDARGNPVRPNWSVASGNPRMVVARGLQTGRFTVIVGADVASPTGQRQGVTLQGPVFIQ